MLQNGTARLASYAKRQYEVPTLNHVEVELFFRADFLGRLTPAEESTGGVGRLLSNTITYAASCASLEERVHPLPKLLLLPFARAAIVPPHAEQPLQTCSKQMRSKLRDQSFCVAQMYCPKEEVVRRALLSLEPKLRRMSPLLIAVVLM
jgi:hypothetical protein